MDVLSERDRKQVVRDAHFQVAEAMLAAMRHRRVGFGFVSRKIGGGYNAQKVFEDVIRQKGCGLEALALFMWALDFHFEIKVEPR